MLQSVAPQFFFYEKKPQAARLRRVMDVALAGVALILAAPIIALAMLAILIEDGGPVLYTQRRAGQFERLFTIVKLRTMRRVDCGEQLSPTSARDPRVTRVGRVLRRLSIDELPQLVNVVRGDMAIVGPRPEMPFVVENYEDWQHLRHLVRPGLTCLWQIKLRSTVPLHRPEATALDIEYIRTASPRVDVVVLAQTLRALVLPKGAY